MSKKWKKTWLILFVFLCSSMAVVFLIYRFDNKYLAKGAQPIQGILSITEEELEKNPTRFLIRDWEFYPGQLLKPKDFKGEGSQPHMKYVSIGERGVMEHGSGTYRLILDLPQNVKTYAIELKEIFSAYELYIDDDLLVKLGEIQPEKYKAQVQNQMVTFRGNGYVQIVIAVTDESYLYSGMTYPPVFGISSDVVRMREVKFFIRTVVFTIAVIVLLSSIYFLLYVRHRLNILAALLGVLLVGYTAYPLLRTYYAAGIFPWYGIELICYYGMILLVMQLHSEICKSVGKVTKLFKRTMVCMVLAVLTLAFVICVHDSELLRSLLTIMVRGLKWAVVAFLLYSSVKAVQAETSHNRIILGATAFFGVSLAADQILPLFEPIYGGWFMELGGVVLIGVMGYIHGQNMVSSYRFQLTFLEKTRQTEQLLNLQKMHYAQLQGKIAETRELRHDMRQHMRVLKQIAETSENDAIKEYATQYVNQFEKKVGTQQTSSFETPLIICENMAVEAILQYYIQSTEYLKIPMEVTGRLPAVLGVPELELCPLIGNILENAVEAVLRQEKEEECYIKLALNITNGKVIINLENTYSGRIRKNGEKYYSSKREGYGIGVESVKRIAERYGGFASFEPGEKTFQVTIFLPLTM